MQQLGRAEPAELDADSVMARINEIEKEVIQAYPDISDPGGSGIDAGDPRQARDKFSEWFRDAIAFDPRRF